MREGGSQNWRHTRKAEDKGSEVLRESRSKAGEGRGDRTWGLWLEAGTLQLDHGDGQDVGSEEVQAVS